MMAAVRVVLAYICLASQNLDTVAFSTAILWFYSDVGFGFVAELLFSSGSLFLFQSMLQFHVHCFLVHSFGLARHGSFLDCAVSTTRGLGKQQYDNDARTIATRSQ